MAALLVSVECQLHPSPLLHCLNGLVIDSVHTGVDKEGTSSGRLEESDMGVHVGY